jgi:hypothetical protein
VHDAAAAAAAVGGAHCDAALHATPVTGSAADARRLRCTS